MKVDIQKNSLFPSGIGGKRSVGGVWQETPELRLVAFVNCVLPNAVNAQ